ncbi:hypothetical protein CEXT_783231 [Caerostris extrusa]|uniref:Uncharacterized protein n=1 Tax=Caerostris extrusa TaxID=172846 RepID=A0AAV4XWM1_CAEEX|nr:hypothetical protein CEXT_783231 [Caerostris extrusa]
MLPNTGIENLIFLINRLTVYIVSESCPVSDLPPSGLIGVFSPPFNPSLKRNSLCPSPAVPDPNYDVIEMERGGGCHNWRRMAINFEPGKDYSNAISGLVMFVLWD